MNVELTPEFEQLVEANVKSGRYSSASEVFQEALRLLEQRDDFLTPGTDEIRKQIDAGWQSAQRGELVDAAGLYRAAVH